MQDVSEDMHAKKENVGASGRFSCLSEIKKRKSIPDSCYIHFGISGCQKGVVCKLSHVKVTIFLESLKNSFNIFNKYYIEN